MTEFYDRNGQRMSLMQWAKAWEDTNYRVLGSCSVSNLWVSTIWLGIDHDVMNAVRDIPMPPLIFESMIFQVDGDEFAYLEMRRYRTEHEAMVGHTEFVDMANMLIDLEKEVMNDPDNSDRNVHSLPEDQGGEAGQA